MEHLHLDLEEQYRVREGVSDQLKRLARGGRTTSDLGGLSQILKDIDKSANLGDDPGRCRRR